MSDITGADNQNDTGQRPGWLIGLRDWVDARLPIMDAWKKHLSEYYAPKNFNFWYFFGVLSMVVLVTAIAHRYLVNHELYPFG
jgi:quinol-cytochrome oxidoreductase complex cytochrome b subunit